LVVVFFLLALVGSIVVFRSAQAAMVLDYFDIFVDTNRVTLEWKTISENELLGFNIYCKEEAEPVSQYHPIGERVAQGNTEQGAVYRFDVAEGLYPGVSYCFRLEEVTLNNERGEIIDRCGYGLEITPTPSATPTMFPLPAASTDITTTVLVSVTPTVILSGTIGQPSVATATSTVTATVTLDQLDITTATPIATPAATFTETFSQPDVVTATPTATFTATPLPPDNGASIEGAPTATATPTTIAESPLLPTIDPNATLPVAPETAAASLAERAVAQQTLPSGDDEQMAASTENEAPAYIILTVTPTAEAVAAAPTFTPFPTASMPVAESNAQLAVLPNTQNLMILLLCGVFSGASGLGVLGLVTTVLYMRSRSEEQRLRSKR
jgi:hypothetical protein